MSELRPRARALAACLIVLVAAVAASAQTATLGRVSLTVEGLGVWQPWNDVRPDSTRYWNRVAARSTSPQCWNIIRRRDGRCSEAYRTIEGGADVDAVYTFAWLDAVVTGSGVRF